MLDSKLVIIILLGISQFLLTVDTIPRAAQSNPLAKLQARQKTCALLCAPGVYDWGLEPGITKGPFRFNNQNMEMGSSPLPEPGYGGNMMLNKNNFNQTQNVINTTSYGAPGNTDLMGSMPANLFSQHIPTAFIAMAMANSRARGQSGGLEMNNNYFGQLNSTKTLRPPIKKRRAKKQKSARNRQKLSMPERLKSCSKLCRPSMLFGMDKGIPMDKTPFFMHNVQKRQMNNMGHVPSNPLQKIWSGTLQPNKQMWMSKQGGVKKRNGIKNRKTAKGKRRFQMKKLNSRYSFADMLRKIKG